MKKRSKRFETLEDIEQSLLRSSGGKKEKRILSGKTAASPPFSLAELWEEYGRLLVIPAICILLMLLILLCEAIAGSGTERPAAQTAAVTAEASGEEGPSAEAAGESLPEETSAPPQTDEFIQGDDGGGELPDGLSDLMEQQGIIVAESETAGSVTEEGNEGVTDINSSPQ